MWIDISGFSLACGALWALVSKCPMFLNSFHCVLCQYSMQSMEAIQLPWHSCKHYCLIMLFIFGNKKRSKNAFLSQVPKQGFCSKKSPYVPTKHRTVKNVLLCTAFIPLGGKKGSGILKPLSSLGTSGPEQQGANKVQLRLIPQLFVPSAFPERISQELKLPSLKLSGTA